MTVRTIDEVFRDYVTDGVPSSGAWKPVKADIRDTLNDLLPYSNRERLSGSRTYYVRTDGDDANTGLANTSGGAFATIQKAIDTAYNLIDLNGNNVTISVGDGTYTGGISLVGNMAGKGTLTITGNTGTPANCVISTTSKDAVAMTLGAAATVQGFKLQTTTSGHCFNILTGAALVLGAMEFGACANMHFNVGGGGQVTLSSSYTISGSAQGHWHVGAFGDLRGSGAITVTLTGTPDFSVYFAGTAQGTVYVPTVTFSGSATGQRYIAHYGGKIIGGGTDNTFLPGDEAGLSNVGGIYQCVTLGATNLGSYDIAPEVYVNNYLRMLSKNYNANTWNTHIKLQNALTQGLGFFYMNGNDSYSSGRTHLSGDATVAVSSGTVDGITFHAKSDIGAQPVFMASVAGQAVGYMRRRGSDGTILGFNRDTTSVGSISVTGSATAYNTSSDYRLKEGDEPIEDAIERLNRLRPIEFAWKATSERVMGFFAHEIADVVPEAVHGEKDAEEEIGTATGPDGETVEGIAAYEVPEGFTWKKTSVRPVYQGIDQAKLVPLLTAALQATVKKIVDLEERLTALEP